MHNKNISEKITEVGKKAILAKVFTCVLVFTILIIGIKCEYSFNVDFVFGESIHFEMSPSKQEDSSQAMSDFPDNIQAQVTSEES